MPTLKYKGLRDGKHSNNAFQKTAASAHETFPVSVFLFRATSGSIVILEKFDWLK